MDIEGSSVPKDLIIALKKLIDKIEPEEHKFILLNNDSKVKLFTDWETYSDKNANAMDNISIWTTEDQKLSLGNLNYNSHSLIKL